MPAHAALQLLTLRLAILKAALQRRIRLAATTALQRHRAVRIRRHPANGAVSLHRQRVPAGVRQRAGVEERAGADAAVGAGVAQRVVAAEGGGVAAQQAGGVVLAGGFGALVGEFGVG